MIIKAYKEFNEKTNCYEIIAYFTDQYGLSVRADIEIEGAIRGMDGFNEDEDFTIHFVPFGKGMHNDYVRDPKKPIRPEKFFGGYPFKDIK